MADKRRAHGTPTVQESGFYKWMVNLLGEEEWPEVEDAVRRTTRDFVAAGALEYDALFDRYEIEMTKLTQMQRLFIQMRKKMDRIPDPNKRFSEDKKTRDREKFTEVLRRYDVPVFNMMEATLNGKAFARMAERLGVIRSSKKEDVEFLFEEYGHYEEEKED